MAEIVTLDQPVAADPGATVFRVALLALDWERGVIKIHLREWVNGAFVPGGKLVPVGYEGDVARTLMTQLNKANLSTQSLHQRVMARVLADGKLPSAGTLTGTPD
jgi:hypothetical protein